MRPRLELPRGYALDLAALRVVVSGTILLDADVYAGISAANLPVEARVAPLGFAWASGLLPRSSAQATWLVCALVVSATLSLVGLCSRRSLAVTSVLLALVLALPLQAGAAVHGHHLLWLCALLAVSPCGDALSLDARRGAIDHGRSARYGAPLWIAWAIVGLIFFFPGYWKLRTQGLGWALSDNLANHLHWKWVELGTVPRLRIDRYPSLLAAGGLWILALELSLSPLLLVRRARPWMVAQLLVFHGFARLWMGIDFSALVVCYAMFVPVHQWTAGIRRSPEIPAEERAPARAVLPSIAVGAILLAGVGTAGFAGIERGWPFACYPTFRYNPGSTVPLLVIEEEARDGSRREWPMDALRGRDGQRLWGAQWSLIARPDPTRLRAHWAAHRPAGLATEVRRVRVYQGALAALPDAQGSRATRVRALAEW